MLLSVNPLFAQSLPDIKDVFRNELACRALQPLLADMRTAPLYQQQATACTAVVPDEREGVAYFSDAECKQPVDYTPTPVAAYCEQILNKDTLGEGLGASGSHWTLSPGTRLDLGARPLDGSTQPYQQRTVYRSVDTAGGRCKLEMRIYKRQPGVQGQRSLIALHGGSWSARGFGFLGLEFSVAHFIEQGFVVYAPFYRLLGNTEGSAACNNSTIDAIVEDAQAALSWVELNAPTYGSDGLPVVFGQSAGAHLATSLAVNQASRVSAAVLFYPPTDFADFALRIQGGYYTNEQGLGILERVMGTTADQVDINASPISDNSFPTRIIEEDLEVPPMFMLHGMADDLVEPRQSVRLCQAIAGTELMPVEQALSRPASLREVRSCGAQSALHLISEGQHALDACVADTLIATDFCLSGSQSSRAEVATAIDTAASFAQDKFDSANASLVADNADDGDLTDGGIVDDDSALEPVTQNQSSGGAVALWLLAIIGISLAMHVIPAATARIRR
ncbi:MAG: alpha/beta hydrolase [Granulosicoccus sp.]|nr:alpha/beta hydrolase [Granulosicoccus sp.]